MNESSSLARSSLSKIEEAELFAKNKHVNMTRKDGKTPYSTHLEDVVSRLKNIGIFDEEILCAGWLHDTIEDTDTNFDDLFERFGRKVAIFVSSLSKDMDLNKKEREAQYTKQLKTAAWEVKIIKLCDISANLSDLKDSGFSKTKKLRQVKQKRHYLNVIKNDLITNKSKVPRIQNIIDGINIILSRHKQRPIIF